MPKYITNNQSERVARVFTQLNTFTTTTKKRQISRANDPYIHHHHWVSISIQWSFMLFNFTRSTYIYIGLAIKKNCVWKLWFQMVWFAYESTMCVHYPLRCMNVFVCVCNGNTNGVLFFCFLRIKLTGIWPHVMRTNRYTTYMHIEIYWTKRKKNDQVFPSSSFKNIQPSVETERTVDRVFILNHKHALTS